MNRTRAVLTLCLGLAFAAAGLAADPDFRVVEKDGKKLYCSKHLVTGSRVKKQKTCLTQDELDTLKEETARGMRNISRQAPPPRGT